MYLQSLTLDELSARLTRLYSAHERADWKLTGLRDGLRRGRDARRILAGHINATENECDSRRGW